MCFFTSEAVMWQQPLVWQKTENYLHGGNDIAGKVIGNKEKPVEARHSGSVIVFTTFEEYWVDSKTKLTNSKDKSGN